MRDSMSEVALLLKAKRDAIWITTYEEAEVVNDIREIISSQYKNMKIYMWSNTEGLQVKPIVKNEKAEPPDIKYREVPALFDFIKRMIAEGDNGTEANKTTAVFILRDLHNLMQDHRTRRCIRDICEYKWNRYCPIIVISPQGTVHEEVAKLFRVIDYGLPPKSLITEYVEGAAARLRRAIEQGKKYTPVSKEDVLKIADACVGLTAKEIDNVLWLSMVKKKGLDLELIMQDKIEAIKKSGALGYKQPKVSIDDIGGHSELKKWLEEQKALLTPEAAAFGLEKPKGFLALGVQGCGIKSYLVA